MATNNLIHLKNPPAFNVLSREDFLNRADVIFRIYSEVLAKTLGAYGSPTIVTHANTAYITKDGYTVARNIETDPREGESIDPIIGQMIMNICSRLNTSVGDGTTTAITATYALFKAIRRNILMDRKFSAIRPKAILDALKHVKDMVIEQLNTHVQPVTSENMKDVIRKVVHVSSNSDELITSMIVDAYERIGFPSISCTESDDAKTYCDIIEAWTGLKIFLGDKLYINSDDKTANTRRANVILFDHKVTIDTYTMIIRPLTTILRSMQRNLICIAPSYDETAYNGAIRREILREMEVMKGSVCFVPCAVQFINTFDKRMYSDLATLLNTTIIDRELEDDLLTAFEQDPKHNITALFKILGDDGEEISLMSSDENQDIEIEDHRILLGFADEVKLSMSGKSSFKATNYNKELYKKALEEAESDLEEIMQQLKIFGTYERDLYFAQKRVAALRMKMAIIRVGGDSDSSRHFLKDSVEDSIRAAESAYANGYVQGCNMDVMHSIMEVKENSSLTMIETALLDSLYDAFQDVYRMVLTNAYGEDVIAKDSNGVDVVNELHLRANMLDAKVPNNFFDCWRGKQMVPMADFIRKVSTEGSWKVFDLERMELSDDIINSVKTDTEVLTAIIDLLSILLLGNQVVIGSYNHLKSL